MKSVVLFSLVLVLVRCGDHVMAPKVTPLDLSLREIAIDKIEEFTNGQTYLSVYSQIYSQSEMKTHNLTVTVSMRNINMEDTVFITKAEYFDTKGKSIRDYVTLPIYIAPMETVEIIIDQNDKQGGTGANFVFDWKIQKTSNPPLFEGVMISTYGQQGLSFTTQGVLIR